MRDGHRGGWTRRQFIAGGLGLASATATGVGTFGAWRQFGREDLIPGDPATVSLEPEAWEVSDDRLSFAALGDNGSGGRQAVAVAEQLCRSYQERPFALVSLLGDICYYGPIEERFDDVFVRPLGPLIDARLPFELAIGNHDGNLWSGEGVPDVQATLERLGTPGRYYAVSHGPVDFFYLDSGAIEARASGHEEQLAWLDEALAASERPWRVVCSHHPLYSSGTHGGAARVRRLVEPILVRHGVDLVLAGHDHHYERSVPIHGVTHVVSGAGCKLAPVDRRRHAAVVTSTLEFLRVDVDGDRLVGEAVDVEGVPIDRFTLLRGDRA